MHQSPTAHEIVRSRAVAAPPEKVWEVVGDFGAIHRWHPGTTEPVLRPSGETVERVFGEGSDAELVERLLVRDDAERRLDYSMVAPPFDITEHRARLVVAPAGAGSTVVWSARFDSTDDVAAELEGVMGDGVFGVGLDALAAMF